MLLGIDVPRWQRQVVQVMPPEPRDDGSYEADTPQSICPTCGESQDDLDGFGVLHCQSCGYCEHPSKSEVNGRWICGICHADCGKVEPLKRR